MNWGGSRKGAGRREVLSKAERERVGQACERAWHWLSGYNQSRAYRQRRHVLLSAAIIFTRRLERFVSSRRIEAAWKEARALSLGPAHPLSSGYSDARAIHDYMDQRLERERVDEETEAIEKFLRLYTF